MVLASAIAFTACDDEVSKPLVDIKFSPDNTTTTISSGRAKANALEFTSGYIKLSHIQFEAETSSGDSIEADIEQLIVIDFATGQTTPDLSSLVFPAGTYSEVEVELELIDENSAPSLVIEGTFTDRNDVAHPIRFEFGSGETFEVIRTGTVSFPPDSRVLAEVQFNPGQWFIDVTSADLEAAVKNTAGVIVISEISNTSIYGVVGDGLDLATNVEVSY